MTIPLLFEQAIEQWGDKEFLVTPSQRITYSEMGRSVRGAAAELQEQGIQKGDRLAIVVEDKATFLRMWLAGAHVGAICIPINPRATPVERDVYLEIADASALATDSVDLVDQIHQTGRVVALFAEPPWAANADADTRQFSTVGIVGSAPLCALFTSGSSGRPKAVLHSHMNMALTGQAFCSWMKLRPEDRLLLCLPLFHMNALGYTTMGAIACGAGLVLEQQFDPTTFWSGVVKNQVTEFNFIGAMISQLVDAEPRPEEKQHAVRVAYGVPALENRHELEERFQVTFVSGYGMTETTFGLIESVGGERRQSSMGKPRTHPDPSFVTRARIVDKAGNDVQPAEVGELLLQSPAQMIGYLDDPRATAERLRDGWLRTGDLVTRDEDGFFYYVARNAGIIRHRGHNVAAHEVESTLLVLPGVQDAAVVGVPSRLYDEDVLAVIVPKLGWQLVPSEVLDACRERLSGFKVPQYVQIVTAIPKTDTFKVNAPALRDLVTETKSWYDRNEGAVVEIPEELQRLLAKPVEGK